MKCFVLECSQEQEEFYCFFRKIEIIPVLLRPMQIYLDTRISSLYSCRCSHNISKVRYAKDSSQSYTRHNFSNVIYIFTNGIKWLLMTIFLVRSKVQEKAYIEIKMKYSRCLSWAYAVDCYLVVIAGGCRKDIAVGSWNPSTEVCKCLMKSAWTFTQMTEPIFMVFFVILHFFAFYVCPITAQGTMKLFREKPTEGQDFSGQKPMYKNKKSSMYSHFAKQKCYT